MALGRPPSLCPIRSLASVLHGPVTASAYTFVFSRGEPAVKQEGHRSLCVPVSDSGTGMCTKWTWVKSGGMEE